MTPLLRLFAQLPLPVVHLLGVLLGWLLYLIPNNHRRISQINIDLCFPELNAHERKQRLRRSLCESGKTLFEAPNLWFSSRRRLLSLIKQVDGFEHIANERKERGVVIVSPHIGSWELIGPYCAMHHPMTIIYRKPRQASLDETISARRSYFGTKLVPIGSRGIRALLSALKGRETIGILPDQDPRDHGGLFAPFFGHPANTPTLLARLIQKSGASAVISVAKRAPEGGGYHLSFRPIADIDSGRSTEEICISLNREIEQVIRKDPELYQWGYKRFRTRPEGEPPIY